MSLVPRVRSKATLNATPAEVDGHVCHTTGWNLWSQHRDLNPGPADYEKVKSGFHGRS